MVLFERLYFFIICLWILSTMVCYSQTEIIESHLKAGNIKFKAQDFASSIESYEKAFVLSKKLKPNHLKKDSLVHVSLKKLITTAGMSKALVLAKDYFTENKLLIFENICTSPVMAIKIGLVNNYIAISVYNENYDEAVKIYESFRKAVHICENFNQIDLVQSSANAAIAYSKINQYQKAIEILPLISYYKDSIFNWTTADYNKVLGFFKEDNSIQPDSIIFYHLRAAKYYEQEKRYAYALDLYDSLLEGYIKYMDNESLINVVERSTKLRDSTLFYQNEIYHNIMAQMGKTMLQRTKAQSKVQKLKRYINIIVYITASIVIILLVYLYKKSNESKNYFKKLYLLEKKFEAQKDKLEKLKSNFIKSNYTLKLNDSSVGFDKLVNDINNNFPEIIHKIHQRFKNLSDKEIQIIYCTLLNLPIKESANLLYMTYGSYRVAKNRLVKKVGFENTEDFEKDLQKLI